MYDEIDLNDTHMHRTTKIYESCTYMNEISISKDAVQITITDKLCSMRSRNTIIRFHIPNVISTHIKQGSHPHLSIIMIVICLILTISSFFVENSDITNALLSIGLVGMCMFIGTAIYYCCGGETCEMGFLVKNSTHPQIYWIRLYINDANVVNDTL